ncbi:MAG TPA: hypothetical protein DIT88_15360 [Planctomycetaceae bacterium]|nr:hypothetical protein [Planctomycetaceae bacterium]
MCQDSASELAVQECWSVKVGSAASDVEKGGGAFERFPMEWLGVQVQVEVQVLALRNMRVAGRGQWRAKWRRTTVLILACFAQGRL